MARFKKGDPKPETSGRRAGTPNRATLLKTRVAERCQEAGLHPADVLLDLAFDRKVPAALRRQCAVDLLMWVEGKPWDGKPPQLLHDDLAATAGMRELEEARKEMEAKIERLSRSTKPPSVDFGGSGEGVGELGRPN